MSGPGVGLLDRSSGVLHRPGSKHLTPACGADVGVDGVTVGPLRALWRYEFEVCRECWREARLGDLVERDGGPVGQLYLNRREVEVVLLALSLLYRLHERSADDDVVVMRSLSTAFTELHQSLGRERS